MSQPNSPVFGNLDALDPPEFEYAYYIPEGTGYLYVDHLGHGQYGTADIVWSCAAVSPLNAGATAQANGGNATAGDSDDLDEDWRYFVRKKTGPFWPRDGYIDGVCYPRTIAEIANQRNHSRIPQFRDWTEYHPLPRTHRNHLQMTSVAMVFQYCNGGTLGNVLQQYWRLRRIDETMNPDIATSVYIPESFIWKVFGQLVEVVSWLHNLRPGIQHGDVHLQNVFLNFSDDNQLMPDCFLGDFGISREMHSDAWDAQGIASYASAAPRLNEYTDIVLMIKELMTLHDGCIHSGGDDQTKELYDRMKVDNTHYSNLLYNQIQRFEGQIADCIADSSNPNFSALARHMVAYSEAMNFMQRYSLRNVSRNHPVGPRTFHSAEELLTEPEDERPAGPWKVAKIRTDTKKVVALSREIYRTYQPLPRDTNPNFQNHIGLFRSDDEHSISKSERDESVGGL